MPTSITSTGITFPNGTTQTTAATSSGGTVTSVATGNGLSGGTITTSGTLSIAAPGANTVGSYAFVASRGDLVPPNTFTFGSNYAAGSNQTQFETAYLLDSGGSLTLERTLQISGTWKWLGASSGTIGTAQRVVGIAVRVA